MRIVAVIPARLESIRLPRKMLADVGGKPLIQHTIDAVRGCRRVLQVVVATDSEEIRDAIRGGRRGAWVFVTEPADSGTERIASIVDRLHADLIVNVQGDEPEIRPEHLEAVIDAALAFPACDMATLATALDPDDQESRDVVKVTVGTNGFAYEFERSYQSACCVEPGMGVSSPIRHVGVYAYRPDFLRWISQQPAGLSEKQERLEQLRALHLGCRIRVAMVDHPSKGIDTPADLEAFRERYTARLKSADSDM
ncbi:MAG: 3-deoxy-manno-octulosonate cytidylyltransferase [Planctomycetaceae bacterium]|nr:3-deoxy-manno-octulosonate cytidylyltransferase [Planctomycetaceae bacterium]